MNLWNADEREHAQLNAKSLNCFFCALKSDDYMRVSTCTSGKEIWERLCLTYEGTNEVKETRINTLLTEYELFRMLPNESITNMFTRFTKITTSLFSLGRFISGQENVRKILRSLPKSWIDRLKRFN